MTALKYRHPAHPCRIELAAEQRSSFIVTLPVSMPEPAMAAR